jgi:C-terminal processing protease CtpA/Prc
MDIFRAMHGANHGEMSGLKLLPLEFFLFDSEVRIITADTSLKKLVGAKVIAVGGKPTKEVLNLLTPLVSKDNEWGGKWILMLQLSDPRILQGLGLGDTTNGVRFTLETINEKTPKEFVIPVADRLLVPSRLEELPGTVSRTQPLNNGRKLGMMNFGKALYVKIDQVSDQHEESFADFTKRIFKTVADSKATTMIIDLRRNHGGQGHLNQELVDRLSASPEFNQQGKLYVLVGRHTFSAAMNFAAQLKLRTKALLLGEPTGSRPNFVGETTLIRLPYSKVSLSISSRFHQNGQSNDTRLWLPPDVPVEPKFDQLVRGYDEALESVLGLVEN